MAEEAKWKVRGLFTRILLSLGGIVFFFWAMECFAGVRGHHVGGGQVGGEGASSVLPLDPVHLSEIDRDSRAIDRNHGIC